MNLKERGITVGDLLIILIIILTTTMLVKSFNKSKKATFNHDNQYQLIFKKALLSKIDINILSI